MRRQASAAYIVVLLGACTKSSPPAPSGIGAGGVGVQLPASTVRSVMSARAPTTTAPLIDLDGRLLGIKPSPPQQTSGRIYSKGARTWIHEAPHSGAAKIGVIRAGMGLDRGGESAGRDGCSGGWQPVLPFGFVCMGEDVTPQADDPVVRALAEFPADLSRALPYIYGTVRRPGPIYRRLPNQQELLRVEPELDKRMQAWLNAPGEIGAGYGQELWTRGDVTSHPPKSAWEIRYSDEPPWFLVGGAYPPTLAGRAAPNDPLVLGQMEPRIGYSLLKTFYWNGRRYGVTADLAVVPTDRLRPIQGSRFHGFRIPQEVDFPFAIIRTPDAQHFQFDQERNRLIPKEPAEYRSAVRLTGKQNFFHGRLHYETTTSTWLSDADASRLDPARRMPAWGKSGEKWIDVNISKQSLVLYEGEKAVYATLVSTGEAGLEDAEHSTATQRGIFRIHTKYISATMDSDEAGEEFELRDVPYVQYFEKGYALHGAYWHDRFGTPKSHGCINLAPEDARRIFFWTEPAVPQGWYGALKPLRGTVLFVHP